jgi:hypothetical protein
LIYINDIGSLTLQGGVRLFADDTTITPSFVELTELVEGVQANLTMLKRYFTANKLTLNPNEISYLVFRTLNKRLLDMPPSIILRDNTDEKGERGQIPWIIYMDEQLNFKWHIEKVRGKISSMVGMLYKLKFHLPSRY